MFAVSRLQTAGLMIGFLYYIAEMPIKAVSPHRPSRRMARNKNMFGVCLLVALITVAGKDSRLCNQGLPNLVKSCQHGWALAVVLK